MSRLRDVNWENKTKAVKKALALHNNENYLKIILENYFLYNSHARFDITEILKKNLDSIKKNDPKALAVQKNIFLEIYSKYIQVTEDLALVAKMLIDSSKGLTPVEIYMESDNSDILKFYRRAQTGFGDSEICKLMGVDKLREYIKSAKHLGKEEVKNYNYIIDESIKIERKNLMMIAKLYIEETKDEKGKIKLQQAGPIDVYNGVKHGFKLVHPTKLIKSIWKQVGDSTVDVMHQVILDKSTGQKIIALGGFGSMNNDIIDSIMDNLKFYAEEIHHICEIRLWTEKDPMFVIKRFRLTKTDEELKNKKISVNEKCLCGSGLKYKKCCKLFTYEFENTDPYSLIEL